MKKICMKLFVLIVLMAAVTGCVSNPAVIYNRGVDAFNSQNYDLAIQELSSFIINNSDNNRIILLNRAEAYLCLGNTKQALDDYQRIGNREGVENCNAPQEAYKLYVKGNLEYNFKNYDSALSLYTEALGLYSDFIYAYIKRGNCYQTLKEYDKAILDFTTATTIKPQDVRTTALAYTALGDTYEGKNDLENAIVNHRRACKLYPDSTSKDVFIRLIPEFLAGKSPDYVVDGNGKTPGTIRITGYKGNAADIIIPGNIEGIPVSTIGEKAFYGRRITSVVIPDSITSIGKDAFANNNLTTVTIPGGLEEIGKGKYENRKFVMENPFGNFLTTAYVYKGRKAGTYRYSNKRIYYNGELLPALAVLTLEVGTWVVSIDGRSPASFGGKEMTADDFKEKTGFSLYLGPFIIDEGIHTIGLIYYAIDSGMTTTWTTWTEGIVELVTFTFGEKTYVAKGTPSGDKIRFNIEEVQ
jgi:tetratricopeptide (TPR) repeat protein